MSTRGFTDYNVDCVIKFGGSLLFDEKQCRAAINGLTDANSSGYRLLIMPGGGPTDKTIESLDRRHPFHRNTHHRACARAQDQTGLMISDPCFSSSLQPAETLEEVRCIIDSGRVAVLLPSRLIAMLDPFERTWDITSDAMAVWLAWLVSARRAVILTDVDGIFTPGHINEEGYLIPSITASNLADLGHTSVDACTAPFLCERYVDSWVLNGRYSERLLAILAGEQAIGTHIVKG
jgi:5-(aminomethyl)-3-furanmethanol phosphate kinase